MTEEIYLIKDLQNYNPKEIDTKVLRDDFRILIAWLSTIESGKEFKYPKELVWEKLKEVFKELYNRGIEFHPDKGSEFYRKIFKQLVKETGVKLEIISSDIKNIIDELIGSPKIDISDWINIITPKFLKQLSDDYLLRLYKRLHEYARDKEKITEDLINLNSLIWTEIIERNIPNFTPIEDRLTAKSRFWVHEYPLPEGFEEYRKNLIFYQDIIDYLPVSDDWDSGIYLVGGVVNNGVGHDIDILITSDLPYHSVIAKLHSILPEEYRNKLHFIIDEEPPSFGYVIPLDNKILLESNKEIEMEKQKIKIFHPVRDMKPCNECEFFNVEEMWEVAKKWLDGGRPYILVSPKWDGFRFKIHMKRIGKDRWRVKAYSEDRKRDRKKYMPTVINALKERISPEVNSIIIDGEWIRYKDELLPKPIGEHIWEKYVQYPREDNIIIIVSKDKFDDSLSVLHIYDVLLINDKSLEDVPYEERMQYAEKYIGTSEHIHITEHKKVKNKEQFMKAVKWARTYPNSEGAMVKDPYHKITFTGRTKGLLKIKNYKEIDAIVLNKRKVKGSKRTYSYTVGVSIPKSKINEYHPDYIVELNGKPYLVVGKLYNTNVNVPIGGIIEYRTIRVRIYEKDGKKIVTHMHPLVVRARPDKDEPDDIKLLEKMAKVGTSLFKGELEYAIDLPRCPYVLHPYICPFYGKFRIAHLEMIKIMKLMFPIKCPLAYYFKCPLIKSYYYGYKEYNFEIQEASSETISSMPLSRLIPYYLEPPEKDIEPAVLQAHMRGQEVGKKKVKIGGKERNVEVQKSIHLDWRIKKNGYLAGYTIVGADVNNINNFPMKPGERRRVELKLPEPVEWLLPQYKLGEIYYVPKG
ncbi:MAG: hypothetical protein DRG33_00890, partial [Deltaproteobacteria bacterium]